MKLAIASDSGSVAQHFGRCPEYTIYEIEGKSIVGQTVIESPSHEPGLLPRLLASHGVNCVIAGGMGPSAVNLFHQNNIQVITGIVGTIEDTVKAYIEGTLQPGESSCEHKD